jgi:methionyl-tRNA formyltransferase
MMKARRPNNSVAPAWWRQPRRVRVVVDNPSWILPFAERLVDECRHDNDDAMLCRNHDEISDAEVVFYLGCTRITPSAVLARSQRNLVVHESALPKGRGFSPLTWQILASKNRIPICLFEAVDEVDAGDVVYRDWLEFNGTELIGEMRRALGEVTISLCRRFLAAPTPPQGEPQRGNATHFARRRPADSRLDPSKTIAEQFELLRVVDNERYPAYFEYRGKRYLIRIDQA